MIHHEYHLHNGRKGAAFTIRIELNATENEIAGVRSDGTLQIRLKSVPRKLEVNRALSDFLAEILQIPQSKIEIVAGHSGKDKLVSILDMDAQTAQQKILEFKG
jgi:uncharacterized protein YggU (UPF0235/DUF167 family)